MQPPINHPIAFASKKLTQAESNHGATIRELLAIVWAAKTFKHQIYSKKITFYTDHKPLAEAVRLKEPEGKIGQLLLQIQHLNYEIKYKPGKSNVVADFL